MAPLTPHFADPARQRRRRPRTVATVAAVLCTLFATLLTAAPPAAATLPQRTSLELSISFAVEKVMNAERMAHGLPTVHMSSNLMLSARRHNVTMSQYNTMSHQLPGEAFFATRITRAGYRWSYAGENIGWNSQLTQSAVIYLQKIMYNEKAPNNGHRLNILNRQYKAVGIDVYYDSAHRKLWFTQDFGRPA
jgi:uncharacterized protein YkwD